MNLNIATMDSNIVTIAGVLFGFCFAVLLFRLGRELFMREAGERNWLAFAEWPIVAAGLLTLGVMMLPLLESHTRLANVTIPRSAILASVVLILGYVPAILAHYRFIGGRGRVGPRDNPEPLERILVILVALVTAAVGAASYILAR